MAKEYKILDFILKSVDIHGPIYDYSRSKYINSNTKLEIGCKIHGYFWQKPKHHTTGSKCPKCARQESISKQSYDTGFFIIESKKVFGDLYDYSKSIYVNSKTRIEIICNEHGSFWKTYTEHVKKKSGCPKCFYKKIASIMSENNISDIEDFIEKAVDVHGSIYDYSKSVYKGSKKKLIIGCKIKGHGEFEQTPAIHLRGSGCPKCGIEKNKLTRKGNVKLREKYKNRFIKRARKIHGNQYDYDNVVWINGKTKVEIYCRKHKKYFWQVPNDHCSGRGCPICGKEKMIISKSLNLEEFLGKAIKTHGIDKFDYSRSKYINFATKLEIGCKQCKKWFWQTPTNHIINKAGCPVCNFSYTLSKGELLVEEFLNSNNIKFIKQKKFEDCKYKNSLRFDFYIRSINVCIEYQGGQHYKPVKKWGGLVNLKLIQKRDQIKRDFCKDRGIKLIEIPYWDKMNISNYIKKYV